MSKRILFTLSLMLLAPAHVSAQNASTQADGSGDYGDGPCPTLGCEMDDHPRQGVQHWFEHGLPTAEHCQGEPSGHGTCHSAKVSGSACWSHPSCLTGLAAMTEAVNENDIDKIALLALTHTDVTVVEKGLVLRSKCNPGQVAAFELSQDDVLHLRIALSSEQDRPALTVRLATAVVRTARAVLQTAFLFA